MEKILWIGMASSTANARVHRTSQQINECMHVTRKSSHCSIDREKFTIFNTWDSARSGPFLLESMENSQIFIRYEIFPAVEKHVLRQSVVCHFLFTSIATTFNILKLINHLKIISNRKLKLICKSLKLL